MNTTAPTIAASGRGGSSRSATNERSILTMSTGSVAQVLQRRVAGAEVVEHEPHAERRERGDVARASRASLQHRGLGDLERRARPAGTPSALSARSTTVDEGRLAELARATR